MITNSGLLCTVFLLAIISAITTAKNDKDNFKKKQKTDFNYLDYKDNQVPVMIREPLFKAKRIDSNEKEWVEGYVSRPRIKDSKKVQKVTILMQSMKKDGHLNALFLRKPFANTQA